MLKAVMSWSSGKDSAFALAAARQIKGLEIVGAISTLNATANRVAMHGVQRAVLEAQLAAINLPPIIVELPYPCSNDEYQARMGSAMDGLIGQGVEAVIFGDIFLEDVRQYRIDQLKPLGVEAIFPLWGRATCELAKEMIASGLETYLCTVDPRVMPGEFCGRRFDKALLNELPIGVDPCGEHGEFHTVVANAPGFDRALTLEAGITIERDGFIYTDFKIKNEKAA